MNCIFYVYSCHCQRRGIKQTKEGKHDESRCQVKYNYAFRIITVSYLVKIIIFFQPKIINTFDCFAFTLRYMFFSNRSGPIWPVSDEAKSAEASPRVCELAQSKEFLQKYGIGQSPYPAVSQPAKSGKVPESMDSLSKPKSRESAKGIMDLGEFPDPVVHVSEGATNAKASGRVQELAFEKRLNQHYVYERKTIWPVSDEAQNATATTRLLQLARHKTALGDTEYDPFLVTIAARRAKPAPRVSQLAQPLPRKTRAKKV